MSESPHHEESAPTESATKGDLARIRRELEREIITAIAELKKELTLTIEGESERISFELWEMGEEWKKKLDGLIDEIDVD